MTIANTNEVSNWVILAFNGEGKVSIDRILGTYRTAYFKAVDKKKNKEFVKVELLESVLVMGG